MSIDRMKKLEARVKALESALEVALATLTAMKSNLGEVHHHYHYSELMRQTIPQPWPYCPVTYGSVSGVGVGLGVGDPLPQNGWNG